MTEITFKHPSSGATVTIKDDGKVVEASGNEVKAIDTKDAIEWLKQQEEIKKQNPPQTT